jgi:glycosyltransferase involved in cell wall biosynthesis
MKIIQLLPSLDTGGTEQSAVDLAIYLKSQQITSFVASKGGWKVKELSENGITHFTLPLHRKSPWAIWANSRRLIKIIDEYNVDILHARSRAPAWAAWLAHKARPSTKFITTFHGTYGASNALKRAYNRVMLKGPWVIANSLFIKQHIINTYGYPADHILVAQRGANPEVFNPARFNAASRRQLLKTHGILQNGPVLTLVGRLTRWKGQHVFLEALGWVKHLEWQAVIVGGPTVGNPYFEELKQLAQRHGIADRIHFAGDQADAAAWYDVSDLCLSCSIRPEAFGRVAVEAQMMAKPVIATALGGSNETVESGKTGWLIEPDSPQALANALANALTHKDQLASMGQRARAWVGTHFTTRLCCENEFNAYKRLLKK